MEKTNDIEYVTNELIYLIEDEAREKDGFINYVAKIEAKGLNKVSYTNILPTQDYFEYLNQKAKETPTLLLENAKKYLNETPFQNILWVDFKGLHVHHKYYQVGKMPWDYPIKDLMTCCSECHKLIHSTTKIPIYDRSGNLLSEDYLKVYSGCNGLGFIRRYEYYENGRCFQCDGKRYS